MIAYLKAKRKSSIINKPREIKLFIIDNQYKYPLSNKHILYAFPHFFIIFIYFYLHVEQTRVNIMSTRGYGGMVDAEDLKSFGYCNRVGSSPTIPTKNNPEFYLC